MNRIKIYLKASGLTQAWLSKEIGISQTSLSKWCANIIQPSLTDLNKIAIALDIEIHKLIEPTKSLTLTESRLKASEEYQNWLTSGEKREIHFMRNIFDGAAGDWAWIVICSWREEHMKLYSITRFTRSLLDDKIKVYVDYPRISADALMIILFDQYSKRFDI